MENMKRLFSARCHPFEDLELRSLSHSDQGITRFYCGPERGIEFHFAALLFYRHDDYAKFPSDPALIKPIPH